MNHAPCPVTQRIRPATLAPSSLSSAFIVSMAVLPEPMMKMGLSLSLLNCMSALQAGVSTSCTVVMYMRWC